MDPFLLHDAADYLEQLANGSQAREALLPIGSLPVIRISGSQCQSDMCCVVAIQNEVFPCNGSPSWTSRVHAGTCAPGTKPGPGHSLSLKLDVATCNSEPSRPIRVQSLLQGNLTFQPEDF